MANPVRKTAVLGDQNQPETWPDMEVVRNSQTQVENQMAEISRGRVKEKSMSEINEQSGTQQAAVSSTSILNQVVEAVAKRSLYPGKTLFANADIERRHSHLSLPHSLE